jgi:hypothetical protein
VGSVDDPLDTRSRTHWLKPIQDARALPADADLFELTALHQSTRLAFVAALQHLPPRQRAALPLTEVLLWLAAEVAEFLDTSVAAVSRDAWQARGDETCRGAVVRGAIDAPRAVCGRLPSLRRRRPRRAASRRGHVLRPTRCGYAALMRFGAGSWGAGSRAAGRVSSRPPRAVRRRSVSTIPVGHMGASSRGRSSSSNLPTNALRRGIRFSTPKGSFPCSACRHSCTHKAA